MRDTDPDTLDSDELDALLRRVAELRAWCDARQVRATRRQRALAAEGRAADPRHSLTNHGRQSSKSAVVAAERERVCTTMPGFEDALTEGVVSAGTKPSWDRLTVDALVEAVSSPTGRTRGSLVVHVDLATLTEDRHTKTLSETDSGVAVPVDTMRRMACEADIIPVVLDGKGVVLDEGRAKRLATAEQRTAIEAMQSSCSHPDCTITIDDCRIHHLRPLHQGGRTDLADLAPVCEPHHHLVHEGGWTLTMIPDRVATWDRPDGETCWTGSVTDRRVHQLAG